MTSATEIYAIDFSSLMPRLLADFPLADILLDCLRYDGQQPAQDRLSRLSEAEWQALVTLARQQRVGPLLYHRLTGQGYRDLMPEPVRETLRQQYRLNTLRNLKLQGELRQIVTALTAAGIPVIALKGIYLASAVYENPGLREMNDLDVLVRLPDIDAAKRVLKEIGYGESQEELPSTSFHHLHPLRKADAAASVELHWTIVPGTSPFKVNLDGLWERAKVFRVAGSELLALSDEDMLLHLFLHSAYMDRFSNGARPLADVAETIGHFQETLNWAALNQRAEQWQCVHTANLSLLLVNQLLHAPLPKAVTAPLHRLNIKSQLVAYALSQLMGKPQEKITIARNFSALWGKYSIINKSHILLRSIFRPPKNIAQMYNLPESSLKVYFYYLVRARDLWLRYGHSARQMLAEESEFASKIELDNALSDWLTAA